MNNNEKGRKISYSITPETTEEIEKLVPCVDASFVIDNLEYLHKGGRCSALAMMGANLLKLKPCIEVKNGKMGVGKKYRGKYDEVLKQFYPYTHYTRDAWTAIFSKYGS